MKFWPLMIFALLLSGCDIQSNGESTLPPERPEAVPETAIWIGGADGGVFIEVSETDKENLYTGSVYHDHNGDVWYQGEFKYTGDKAFEPDERSSYRSWDGTVLYLSNQGRLIAQELEN